MSTPVMPEFPPVIVRDNMLCLEGGDDGKMIWDLMLAVNEAVDDNLTLVMPSAQPARLPSGTPESSPRSQP